VVARGKALWQAGDYLECVRVLSQLFAPEGNRRHEGNKVDKKARLYYAACLLGSGQPEEADSVFRDAIRNSPQLRPNPLEFPRPVVDRFNRVRQTMLAVIKRDDQRRAELARRKALQAQRAQAEERARQRELIRLAEQETVLTQNRRWVAAVPFGVGQFQNDSPALGWLMLTTQAAALGTTIGALSWELALHAKSDDPEVRGNLDELRTKETTARRVWTVSLYSFGALAVAGILEAQLSFVPESEQTRRRPIPKRLLKGTPQQARGSDPAWLDPVALPLPTGLQLGVRGRF
jgi:hypothetical protein